MVNDADKYKAEDEKQKSRISAKNGLESYAFHMKSTVEDEKLKDKIGADDKKTIVDKCNDVSIVCCNQAKSYQLSLMELYFNFSEKKLSYMALAL